MMKSSLANLQIFLNLYCPIIINMKWPIHIGKIINMKNKQYLNSFFGFLLLNKRYYLPINTSLSYLRV